jgi:hypothetical protein
VRHLLDVPSLLVDTENDDKNTPLHYFAQVTLVTKVLTWVEIHFIVMH